MDAALDFIRENADRPFFCYLPITPPHGMYDIPADDPAWEQYAGDDWMRDEAVDRDVKNYAAMVTMVDNDLGRVLDLLTELELEDDTLVFFTGDNGGWDRFGSEQQPRGFFGPNVDPRTGIGFRGGKGNLYEGGLRIPFLVRWPGKIAPGRVSDLCFYQPDVLPTLAELTGTRAPDDVDGLSILPELLGPEAVGREQAEHEFLYWEYGSQVAVRSGDWKAIRGKKDRAWELYDLATDESETTDVADQYPELLQRMREHAQQSHEPVRPGKYSDRTRHERDRRAKWGSARKPGRGEREANRLETAGLIPFDELKLVRFSSENTSNDRLAKHAIDGDPRTVWHSRWSDRLARHPHELVIDLGESRAVRGFRYLARQDGGWNGTFAETHFWVSDSLDSFGDPVLKATFEKVRTSQAVACEQPVRGRYVRIRVLSEVNGGAWGSAADIGVVGE